jgi:adenosylcobyric acid synthase
MPDVSGAIMVCGATSNAGKSTLVAGICRHYARRGLRVAPFKAQNMANNSAVTASGHEIGRAQAWQAMAARTEAEVAMNPVLLKPTGPGRSQVVVMGRPVGTMSAAAYHRHKPELLGTVLAALAELRERYDVVVLEGAGSPAEINLLDADIVNLRVAHEANIGAVVVGDIDLGGVFASLFGTVALLPDHYRELVRGFVINKLRGDPDLLFDGPAMLERRCGVPTLGVLPWLAGPEIDSEDSLVLDRPMEGARASDRTGDAADGQGGLLDVAVVRLPHIANFTDLDALRVEPGVALRWVDDPRAVGQPDLLIVPGSKSTAADLAWLRARRLDQAIAAITGFVLGVCAGYQMLGRRIEDPAGVESTEPVVDGLGLLDATTRFGVEKVTRWRDGKAFGEPVRGYQIYHGVVEAAGPALVDLGDGSDGTIGVTPAGGTVWGTTLHGFLDGDAVRGAVLSEVGRKVGKRVAGVARFERARQSRIDRIADAVEAHLDLEALDRIVSSGALR